MGHIIHLSPTAGSCGRPEANANLGQHFIYHPIDHPFPFAPQYRRSLPNITVRCTKVGLTSPTK